jgi:hypothetical protein
MKPPPSLTKPLIAWVFALAFGHQLATATSLVFDSPTLESGTALQPGAVYRFGNITTGVDALLTVTGFNNGGSIGSIDDFGNGGYQSNFQPTINGTPSLNSSVDFHFQFVLAGTSTPTSFTNLDWTTLDVDGDGTMATREYVTYSGFQSYTLDNPTHIGVQDLGGGSYQFTDTDGINQPGIGLGGAFALTVNYASISSFDLTMGMVGTGGYFPARLFSEGSGDATYVAPETTVVPEPGGAILLGTAGLLVLLRRRRILG